MDLASKIHGKIRLTRVFSAARLVKLPDGGGWRTPRRAADAAVAKRPETQAGPTCRPRPRALEERQTATRGDASSIVDSAPITCTLVTRASHELRDRHINT